MAGRACGGGSSSPSPRSYGGEAKRIRSARHARPPPDRAVAVFGDQERAVLGDRNSDRPPPDLGVIDNEARHEIFVLAGRLAVLHPDTDHLVAGALRAIPGAVLGG